VPLSIRSHTDSGRCWLFCCPERPEVDVGASQSGRVDVMVGANMNIVPGARGEEDLLDRETVFLEVCEPLLYFEGQGRVGRRAGCAGWPE